MAFASYPFENTDTTENQYTLLFKNFAHSGIVGNWGDGQFALSANNSGLDVQIAAGYAIVRGHAVSNDLVVDLPVAAADAALPRIDRIVLRLDPAANGIIPTVVQGTPAAVPTVPALVQTETGIYDLPVGYVRVAAGALNLADTDITMDRLWTGSDTGVWDNARRPANPRLGLLGYNVERLRWEFWDGDSWEPVTPSSAKTVRVGHTFTLVGEVQTATGDDYYIPGFYVAAPPGQTARIVGVRSRINSGTEVAWEIVVNGVSTSTPMVGVSTTSQSQVNFSQSVLDGVEVSLRVRSITNLPKNLNLTVFVEYTV